MFRVDDAGGRRGGRSSHCGGESDVPKEVVHPPGAGRVLHMGADRAIVKVEPSPTGGFALVEYVLSPGGGPGQHAHEECNETYFVLEGEIVFRLGRQTHVMGAGGLVHVPAGNVHGFRNETDEPARLLWLFEPGHQLHAMGWERR
jgi:quercetin dioxygenase-like cupin family protein